SDDTFALIKPGQDKIKSTSAGILDYNVVERVAKPPSDAKSL
nr:hypothetical protein [Tanacetum cinerariifolium]